MLGLCPCQDSMRHVTSTSCETKTCETGKQNVHHFRSVVKQHTTDLPSLQPKRFNEQQVRARYEPHLSLSVLTRAHAAWLQEMGVTSPQYLLSVIIVRFSGPDRPE